MSAILKLVQGTQQSHEHCAKSRNASETPAVLALANALPAMAGHNWPRQTESHGADATRNRARTSSASYTQKRLEVVVSRVTIRVTFWRA